MEIFNVHLLEMMHLSTVVQLKHAGAFHMLVVSEHYAALVVLFSVL